MTGLRALGLWGAVLLALAVPVVLSLLSPLLAWRDPIYIVAGLAGVLAMAVLLLQPLLAMGLLPGLSGVRGRRLHRWTGASLVALIVLHVFGLWLTSPPDVVDALAFASPTPFTPWGVIAMWAVFGAALLAVYRKRLRPRHWRRIHTALAAVTVVGSGVHAMLIEGTMEFLTKSALCALVLVATAIAVSRVWRPVRVSPSAGNAGRRRP